MTAPSTRLESVLASALTRRDATRSILGAGAALVAVAAAGNLAFAQGPTNQRVATSNLNLRSGPGTQHAIVTVVPRGATVTVTGAAVSGYTPVTTHGGAKGYVLSAGLTSPGTGQGDPVITGQRRTTANVNLRSGPGAGNSVLRVVPSGSPVQSSDTVRDGFRYVIYGGQAGWIADSYLALPGNGGPVPGTQVTTSNLNLRAAPNATARVLLVMPAGATVRPNGSLSNGFAQVNYQGTVGWAATAYLK